MGMRGGLGANRQQKWTRWAWGLQAVLRFEIECEFCFL